MSWRDNLRPASFRGVPFQVDTLGGKNGRRAVLHEYPQRDEPFAEDMGRRARRHSLQAFVLGDDYIAQRDRLLTALEEFGPGLLVHPTKGSLTVQVEEVSTSESKAEGGFCQFDISFFEAGQRQFPASTADTRWQVDQRAGALGGAQRGRFARLFNLRGPDFLRQGAMQRLLPALDQLSGLGRLLPVNQGAGFQRSLRGVPGMLDASGPGDTISEALGGLFDMLGGAGLGRPAMSGLRGLGGYAPYTLDSSPVLTASRKQATRNSDMIDGLVRALALGAEARTGIDVDWQVHDDAIMWRDDFGGRVQAEADLAQDDSVFLGLTDLHRSVRSDIAARALLLPRLRPVQPASPVPAAVLAYRLYGTDGDAEAITRRNGVMHGGFLPPRRLLTIAPPSAKDVVR